MVSQLFVELSMVVLVTLLMHWPWLSSVFAFDNYFGDGNYFEETSSLLSPFFALQIFEFWVRSSDLKTGEPRYTNASFLMQLWLFLGKAPCGDGCKKVSVSVNERILVGTAAIENPFVSVTMMKRRRIDRRPCSELKV